MTEQEQDKAAPEAKTPDEADTTTFDAVSAEPAAFTPPEAPPAKATPVPAPEPTPTVPAAEASYSHPAGSAAPSALSPDAYADRPEVLVGAAFAGGALAALILKRLGR